MNIEGTEKQVTSRPTFTNKVGTELPKGFLLRFEIYADNAGWTKDENTKDQRMIREVVVSLRGKPWTWHHGRVEERIKNFVKRNKGVWKGAWEVYKVEFLKTYAPENQVTEVMNSLKRVMSQKQGEPLGDFWNSLRTALLRIGHAPREADYETVADEDVEAIMEEKFTEAERQRMTPADMRMVIKRATKEARKQGYNYHTEREHNWMLQHMIAAGVCKELKAFAVKQKQGDLEAFEDAMLIEEASIQAKKGETKAYVNVIDEAEYAAQSSEEEDEETDQVAALKKKGKKSNKGSKNTKAGKDTNAIKKMKCSYCSYTNHVLADCYRRKRDQEKKSSKSTSSVNPTETSRSDKRQYSLKEMEEFSFLRQQREKAGNNSVVNAENWSQCASVNGAKASGNDN